MGIKEGMAMVSNHHINTTTTNNSHTTMATTRRPRRTSLRKLRTSSLRARRAMDPIHTQHTQDTPHTQHTHPHTGPGPTQPQRSLSHTPHHSMELLLLRRVLSQSTNLPMGRSEKRVKEYFDYF